MSRQRIGRAVTTAQAARIFLLGAIAVGAVAAVASCGSDDNVAGGGSRDASVESSSEAGVVDAGMRDAAEAAPPVDAARPDGGPAPIVACGDAGTDAAGECALPPSRCIDDHWLRFYTSGGCTDAGVCDFEAMDMRCDPSPTPPDCYQGGCRLVIVR